MPLAPPPQARGPVLLALFGLLALSSAARAGGELLPLEPGMSVVTRSPQYFGLDLDQPETLVIFDTRDPECALGVERAINWSATRDWNQMPNATGRVEDEWSVTNLGPAFGVAIDDADPPNIYVTTAPVYLAMDDADGRVSRIDGGNGAVSRIATLPNTDPNIGLGNICFDAVHQQLHVSNFEDGKLYRLALDGSELSTFDPWLADDGLSGFAPLAERIWGVAGDGERVYFGTWRRDGLRRSGPENGVYSVALDAAGDYLPDSLREEFLVPQISDARPSMPIADIALSTDLQLMIVGERSMNGDSGSGAHGSRVLSYLRVGDSWVLSSDEYSVGFNNGASFFGWNAAGGVDVDQCVSDPDCPEEEPKVYAMGDALIFDTEYVYGLQIFPLGGGFVGDSYVLDLDDELSSQDKTALGDVEVMRHAESAVPNEPPVFEVAWVEDPSECNLGLRIAWEAAGFDPPDSGSYAVYRSETSCADAIAAGPVASGLTELSWLDRDTEAGVPYHYVVEALTPPTGGGCTPVGPPLSTAVCLDGPVEDSGSTAPPDVVWAVLRARHEGQSVTFHWDSVRSLLPAEHFHLLKTAEDPSTAFSHVNGEADVSLEWTELDTSSWLQFFDLRVANRCEDLSEDEYPPGF